MGTFKFSKELYGKTALIKAAYNYTDIAYIHLDADRHYYVVSFEAKPGNDNINEDDFINEMLIQALRHEVYKQTKNIRELLLARAMATSVVIDDSAESEDDEDDTQCMSFDENEILKDWFDRND